MSIGNALYQARTSAGLTVEAVSEVTRIRADIVQRIEEDDFTACGGDFYARGHIRTLARTLKCDPTPLLAEFDADHAVVGPTLAELADSRSGDLVGSGVGLSATGGLSGGGPSAAAVGRTGIQVEGRGGLPATRLSLASTRRRLAMPRRRAADRLRRTNWAATLVALCVVVLAVAVFELVTGRHTSRPVAGTIGRTGARTAAPHAARHGAVPVVAPPGATASPTAGVSVVLDAEGGTSWIEATGGDGRTLLSRQLTPGAVATLTDSAEINLTISNAGAVRLRVNGVELGAQGDKGQLVRLHFGPGRPTPAPARVAPPSVSVSVSAVPDGMPSPSSSP